jgi:hypothetical protein
MLRLPGFVVLTVSDNDRELEQAVETTAKWVCGPECGCGGGGGGPGVRHRLPHRHESNA